MTHQRLQPTYAARIRDQFDQTRETQIAGEAALTLIVNGTELVTLMTLGMYPEELALGYLYNQRLVENISDIESVKVDWERERADVKLRAGKEIAQWQEKLGKRIVTSGCGQGTIFSCTLDRLYEKPLPGSKIRQSVIYALLERVTQQNHIYRAAGAVHGCALCRNSEILFSVEDVGRHNAADAIAGMMWLENIPGNDKVFYTTGRLTSEIVMKSAYMGIPILLSRSGVTHMGMSLAVDLNVTIIARAKGKAFRVYHNAQNIIYDAKPAMPKAS